MAENKKSFILYSDMLSIVEKLTLKDREDGTNNAGELMYHILQYVNDREPEPVNFIVEMAFEPIKIQLKRDLKKYEAIRERNRANGLKGGRPKKKSHNNPENPVGNLGTQHNPKKPDSDSDNDNVLSKDNKKTISKDIVMHTLQARAENFKESIKPYLPKYGRDMCNDFYLYWTEPNKSKTKLRYELQKTWDIGRRLGTWAKNDKNFNGNGQKKQLSNKPTSEELNAAVEIGLGLAEYEKEKRRTNG